MVLFTVFPEIITVLPHGDEEFNIDHQNKHQSD
jgi:hypothetical protein